MSTRVSSHSSIARTCGDVRKTLVETWELSSREAFIHSSPRQGVSQPNRKAKEDCIASALKHLEFLAFGCFGCPN